MQTEETKERWTTAGKMLKMNGTTRRDGKVSKRGWSRKQNNGFGLVLGLEGLVSSNITDHKRARREMEDSWKTWKNRKRNGKLATDICSSHLVQVGTSLTVYKCIT